MTPALSAVATAIRISLSSDKPTACERIGTATWIAVLMLLAASMALGLYDALTPT